MKRNRICGQHWGFNHACAKACRKPTAALSKLLRVQLGKPCLQLQPIPVREPSTPVCYALWVLMTIRAHLVHGLLGPLPFREGRPTRDAWELLRASQATRTSHPEPSKNKPFWGSAPSDKFHLRSTRGLRETTGLLQGLRGYYGGYRELPEATGERHNILRLEVLLQVSIPANAKTRKRTLTQTPTSEQNPERPLSISARKEEGSDLGSTRVPTYQHSYANPPTATHPTSPTDCQHSCKVLQQPTATDQRSEGSGSADEGLGLGSGQSNKVLQAHLRHARRLAALRRRLETLPSYGHSYVCPRAIWGSHQSRPSPSGPATTALLRVCVCVCCVQAARAATRYVCMHRAAVSVLLWARHLRAALLLSDHVHDSCCRSYLEEPQHGKHNFSKKQRWGIMVEGPMG